MLSIGRDPKLWRGSAPRRIAQLAAARCAKIAGSDRPIAAAGPSEDKLGMTRQAPDVPRR
jgi:hypothetical protein